jgi:hypothetical protein
MTALLSTIIGIQTSLYWLHIFCVCRVTYWYNIGTTQLLQQERYTGMITCWHDDKISYLSSILVRLFLFSSYWNDVEESTKRSIVERDIIQMIVHHGSVMHILRTRMIEKDGFISLSIHIYYNIHRQRKH